MIRFLLTKGYGHTMKKVRKSRDRPTLGVVHYEDIFRARSLRPATYVFTDLDRLSPRDLEHAARLYLLLKDAGLPRLNNPAVVKKRYALLRALHAAGLNDFNAYRAEELPAEMRFPVFLRKEHGHGSPLSDLMHSREEVLQAVNRAINAGVPLDEQIVIEYAGEPVREGKYRKMAAFCFRGEIVPHFSVNDKQWLVKDGYMDLDIEDLYLRNGARSRPIPARSTSQKAFEIARIDYGRADFAFYKGRIQIFEINTNPNVPAYTTHPSATRLENMRIAWEKYLKALRTLDSPSGKPVSFPLHEPDHADNAVAVQEARRKRIRAAQQERDTRLGVAEISSRIKYTPGTTIEFFRQRHRRALHPRRLEQTGIVGHMDPGKKHLSSKFISRNPPRAPFASTPSRVPSPTNHNPPFAPTST